jgi:DNA modification methylase
MADFGFGDDDIERIERENDGPVMVDEDEPPEQEPVESRVKLGEIWQLGDHRLMCGSSTDPADVARLMSDVKDAFLFTSPPYADMRDYNGDKDVSVSNLSQFIGAYAPYCEFQAVNLGIKRTNSEIVQYWDDYIRAAHDAGLKLMAWNIWDKGMCGSVGQQMALVPIRHEFVFMFAQHDFTFVFGGHEKPLNRTWEKKPENINETPQVKSRRNVDGTMRYDASFDASNPYKEMESVVRITPEMNNDVRQKHPAPFPVQLPAEYIAAFTPKQGGIVAEPFSGSGTTIIACEQLGRSCRAMELDPAYCEVAIQRWESMTGETARRID